MILSMRQFAIFLFVSSYLMNNDAMNQAHPSIPPYGNLSQFNLLCWQQQTVVSHTML